MCLEWEDDHWNSENGVVPCGSSVSSTTDRQYTRVLKMISDQKVPSCPAGTQRLLTVKSRGQIQRTCKTSAAAEKKGEEFLKKESPPVPDYQIKGSWWTDSKMPYKTYGFVEEVDLKYPWTTRISLTDGRTLVVNCLGGNVLDSAEKKKPGFPERGLCIPLDPYTWNRISLSDVYTVGAKANGWGMYYRHSADAESVTFWRVLSVCERDGVSCKTVEQRAER